MTLPQATSRDRSVAGRHHRLPVAEAVSEEPGSPSRELDLSTVKVVPAALATPSTSHLHGLYSTLGNGRPSLATLQSPNNQHDPVPGEERCPTI
jgi:hypothetical protein